MDIINLLLIVHRNYIDGRPEEVDRQWLDAGRTSQGELACLWREFCPAYKLMYSNLAISLKEPLTDVTNELLK